MTGKRSSKQIAVAGEPGEDKGLVIARTVLRPSLQAAATLQEYDKGLAELDLAGLVDALTEQTKAANNGDLGRGEAMLAAQAHVLDAIFNNLSRRAINAEFMDSLDRYLRLALRAQSQSRASWEALSAIQNPPVMGFIKQANIANGPQQVNNAHPSGDDESRARENAGLQNKLLEEHHGERLDTGTKSPTGEADPAVATVGKRDRSNDGDR